MATGRWQQVRHALELVAEDIRAVCENDPAARSPLEVALVYPGLHALWVHRGAHTLHLPYAGDELPRADGG